MQLRCWVLPDGRSVTWSLLEIVGKKPDELIDPNAQESYHTVGNELEFEPLGTLPDLVFGAQLLACLRL